MSEDEFKVGDLIALKWTRTPSVLAIVVALEAIVANRILIQHCGTSGPEMAAPEHWEVVSRCESR